jgi:putative transcriptional regulator
MATKTRKTETGILATVHRSVAGLHRVGVVDKATLREFDALCLTPVEGMSPEEIRASREREQVSEPVFAKARSHFGRKRHLPLGRQDCGRHETSPCLS